MLITRKHTKSYNMDLGPGTWDNKEWLRFNVNFNLQSGACGTQASSGTTQQVGHRILLPYYFYGCPRYMQQQYHYAMLIVLARGTPDFCLKDMKCKLSWGSECSFAGADCYWISEMTIRFMNFTSRQSGNRWPTRVDGVSWRMYCIMGSVWVVKCKKYRIWECIGVQLV